jgi:hypothetical protein
MALIALTVQFIDALNLTAQTIRIALFKPLGIIGIIADQARGTAWHARYVRDDRRERKRVNHSIGLRLRQRMVWITFGSRLRAWPSLLCFFRDQA